MRTSLARGLNGAMARTITKWLAFWTAFAGLGGALLIPASCLFLADCHINAGSQLGVGVTGVVGGALSVLWWQYHRRTRHLR